MPGINRPVQPSVSKGDARLKSSTDRVASLKPANLMYFYDGSLEGFYCCVFECYSKKERPQSITPHANQLSLLPQKNVSTDPQKAARVARALPQRMGRLAAEQIPLCFLTPLENKEDFLLDFIDRGLRIGSAVMNCWEDPSVHAVLSATRHLTREAHLFKGFVRFSDYDGVLVSVIRPKNQVLPLLKDHFCDRFAPFAFFIYDETHHMGLIYRPYEWKIIPIDNLFLDAPDHKEERFRALWRRYYQAIAIKERYNPTCRQTHMPKRYWGNMTEFDTPSSPSLSLPD